MEIYYYLEYCNNAHLLHFSSNILSFFKPRIVDKSLLILKNKVSKKSHKLFFIFSIVQRNNTPIIFIYEN